MANSIFCLAPRGRAVWSPRLVEALRVGCIPVFIADQTHRPFDDVLDYNKFSVSVKESQVPFLHEIIANISEKQIRILLEGGKNVRHLFRYPALDEYIAHDDSVVTLALFSAWERMNMRTKPSRTPKQNDREKLAPFHSRRTINFNFTEDSAKL
eukprot:gene2094-5148_t